MSLLAKDPNAERFYRRVIYVLNKASIPFLLGGGYAFEFQTRITRSVKDLDLFVHRADVERVFRVMNDAGFRTELTFAHWLGKIFFGNLFIDVIFSSGNGLCEVDRGWFENGAEGRLFGLPVRYCPVEEMVWSKAFVMERERYDGSDIAHLILRSERLDWNRLLKRFGPHWRVLLSHLILFGYIYPSDRQRVPPGVLRELLSRLEREIAASSRNERLCQGSLLSRTQYLVDIEELGYKDARLGPDGNMTREETAEWTAAAKAEERKRR
jgi:hypothetical protein